MKIISILLILMLMLLTACTGFRIVPSPSPPLIVHVGITPSLAPILQEDLDNCAHLTSGMCMILDVIPKTDLSLELSDIIIQIGETSKDINGFAVQIGWEEIVLIASSDVDVSIFDKKTIQEEFSSPHPRFNIWIYPENHEIRNIFDTIFEIEEITPYGLIVPDPTAMLESIELHLNAIGYLPKSWNTLDINTISLNSVEMDELILPVLVLMEQKPQEPITSFIGCLQQE